MRIHILGICGTFMAGIARLACALGHEVSGADANIYPPMSTQLAALNVKLYEGYDVSHLTKKPDLVIVGNVIKRGNVEIEFILNGKIPYISGPDWLSRAVLKDRWVLAVSGTHGKTTTSSMLAWILDYAGLNPGFLIGGVPENFGISSRLGGEQFFVIEADEYDTAFFDKRSKFVHYSPRTLILNNVEFDHADIFKDLDAVKTQFHHLIRTVPANGELVVNALDENLKSILAMGCWTPIVKFNDQGTWHLENINALSVDIYEGVNLKGHLDWALLGRHNFENGLAAIVAAKHAGVTIEKSIEALTKFKNVKRRLETKTVGDVTFYDDFAHHPTAIKRTLEALRENLGKGERILAIIELGSHTMKMGVHQETLIPALSEADLIFIKQPNDVQWNVSLMSAKSLIPVIICQDDELLVKKLKKEIKPGDHVIVMSNTGFNRIIDRV